MNSDKTLAFSFALSAVINLTAVSVLGYSHFLAPGHLAGPKPPADPMTVGVIHLPAPKPTPPPHGPTTLTQALAMGWKIGGKPDDDDVPPGASRTSPSPSPSPTATQKSAASGEAVGMSSAGGTARNAVGALRAAGTSGISPGHVPPGALALGAKGAPPTTIASGKPGDKETNAPGGPVMSGGGAGDKRDRVAALPSHSAADAAKGGIPVAEAGDEKDAKEKDGAPDKPDPERNGKPKAANFIMPKVAKMWTVPPGQKIVLPDGLKLVLPKDLPVVPGSTPLSPEQLDQLRKLLHGQNLRQMKGLTKEQLKKMLGARKDSERQARGPQTSPGGAPPPDERKRDVAANKPRPKPKRDRNAKMPGDQTAPLPIGLTSPFRYRPWNPAWRNRYAPIVRDDSKDIKVADARSQPKKRDDVLNGKAAPTKQKRADTPHAPAAPRAAAPNDQARVLEGGASGTPGATTPGKTAAPSGDTAGAGNTPGKSAANADSAGGVLGAGSGSAAAGGGGGTPGNGKNMPAGSGDGQHGNGTGGSGSAAGNPGGKGTLGGGAGGGGGVAGAGGSGAAGTGDGKNAAPGGVLGGAAGGTTGAGPQSGKPGGAGGKGAGQGGGVLGSGGGGAPGGAGSPGAGGAGGSGKNQGAGQGGTAAGGGAGSQGSGGRGTGKGTGAAGGGQGGGVLGAGGGGGANGRGTTNGSTAVGGGPAAGGGVLGGGGGGGTAAGSNASGGQGGGSGAGGSGGGAGGSGAGGGVLGGGGGAGNTGGGQGGSDTGGAGGALGGFDGGGLGDSEGIAGEVADTNGDGNGSDTGYTPAFGVAPNFPEHNHDQQKGLPGALVLPPLPPQGTESGKATKPRPVKKILRSQKAAPHGAALATIASHAEPKPVTNTPRRPLVAVVGSTSRRGTVSLIVIPRTDRHEGEAERTANGLLSDRPSGKASLAHWTPSGKKPAPDRAASPLGIAEARRDAPKEEKIANSKGIKDGSQTPLPPTPLPDSDAELGDGSGLKGEYFLGRNFEQFQFSRADPNLDLFWGGDRSPSPRLPVGADWSCRWTGKIMPRYSETYTLFAVADDGVRVWINHKLLIDDWTLHPLLEYSGQIRLEAGKQYDIRVDYFESGGPPASVGVYWESAHQKKEFIPEERLFYPLAGDKAELDKDEKPHR